MDGKSVVEDILPYERDFFLWLNSHTTDFWDRFMYMYSGKMTWLPLVIACLFVFVYKVKWREALVLIVCSCLVGLLCDQLSASVIKPLFERLRPTHHPDFKDCVDTYRNYLGGRLGFVSAHAANGFGIVAFSSLLFRYRPYTIAITIWALVTCYSRIYLGVHFVSDVVGGMIVGLALGTLSYYIYLAMRYYILRVPKHELRVPKHELRVPILSHIRAKILIGTIIVLVLTIFIYALMPDIWE